MTVIARRTLITRATLSAAAVGFLGGTKLAFAAGSPTEGDLAILNVALGLEHEAIAAYQIGAESGLLKGGVLDTAVLFQSHHKTHRDAQIGAIKKLGGKPVEAKSADEYKKSTKLAVASIKTAEDVLRLAQRLELGAVNAYIGVMPSFADRSLSTVASKLLADEVMHYTALTSALNEALPKAGLSFGG
ncbi:MAG: ferritin-like domain-containing protein [Archangium sp.]